MGKIITDNIEKTFRGMKTAAAERNDDRDYPVLYQNAPSLSQEVAIFHRGNVSGSARVASRQSNTYSRTEFLEPDIRNPLMSASNFYLPQTLIQLNAWIRYFDRFHPIVGNAIDMHATVPFSRFQLTGISDKYVQQFYEDMSDEMNLFRNLLYVSREYELMGEVFPFLVWNDEMNAFDDIVILNPDYIDVNGIKIGGKKGLRYEMVISEDLRQFIMSDDPLDWDIIQDLDPAIVRAAESGLNAPLHEFNLSHIAHFQSPYDKRGTSRITGCLKDLMYEEKLREAQFSIAGGIVRPREIWKLGIPREYMPTDSDLQDLRALIKSFEYDPNAAIISHHGLNVDFIGAERRLLPVIPELQEVEKRILTRLYVSRAMTTGEGPCLLPTGSDGKPIEVLTKNGFVPWYTIEDDEPIASFNSKTEMIEFYVPKNFIFKDYDGEIIDINSKNISLPVTANHRMWVGDKNAENWKIVPAEDLKKSHRLRCNMKPQIGNAPPKTVVINGYLRHRWNAKYRKKSIEIPLDDYLKFAGYYLSEGHIEWNKRCKNHYPATVGITQSLSSKHFEMMKTDLNKLPVNVSFDGKSRFRIYNRIFAEHIQQKFGSGAANKRIDPWIKNLPAVKLEILINAMMAGDGHEYVDRPLREYYTVSEQLAKDFQEIAFRAGYVTYNKCRIRDASRQNLYRCKISKSKNSKLGYNPSLRDAITKRYYKGKVWCFEVPPHELFIVRSAGRIFVVGNTYSNAAVAMKILDARYATKRDFLVDWMRNSIFLPVALANEFYKPIPREINGHYRVANRERSPMIPDFKWLSLVNLVEQERQIQYAVQLHQNSGVPLKTVCDLLQVNYDEVKDYLRKEQGTVADPVWQSARKQASDAAARSLVSDDSGESNGLFPEKTRSAPSKENGDDKTDEKKEISKDVEENAEKDEKNTEDNIEQIGRDEKQKEPKQPGKDIRVKTFSLDKELFGEKEIAPQCIDVKKNS